MVAVITRAELEVALGDVVLIEALPAGQYAAGHPFETGTAAAHRAAA